MDLNRHTDDNALFQVRRRNRTKLLENLTKASKKNVDDNINQEQVLSNDDNSAVEIYKTYRRHYNLPYCRRLANAALRIHNMNALRYRRIETTRILPFVDKLVPEVKGDNVFTTEDANYGNLSSTLWEMNDPHLESIPATMNPDIDMCSASLDTEPLLHERIFQDSKSLRYFQDHENKVNDIIDDDLAHHLNQQDYKHKTSIECNAELMGDDVQPSSKTNSKLECNNCHTKTTPIWRKGPHGTLLCNACGLFGSIHGGSRKLPHFSSQKMSDKSSGNHNFLWLYQPYKENEDTQLEMSELPSEPPPPFPSQSTDTFRKSTSIIKDKETSVNPNHFDFTSHGDAIDKLLNANLFYPDSVNGSHDKTTNPVFDL